MVGAGYTHSFCTPHIWPTFPGNTAAAIPELTVELQAALNAAGVPLTLSPGGEINLQPTTRQMPVEELVTYGMRRKHVLFDLWADELPDFFEPSVRWFQSLGVTPILAHPERMKAVQDDPSLADRFAEMGLLMQGNLQCFADPPGTPTHDVAARFLAEGRYFMLGCDLHRIESLPYRLQGLARAKDLAGEKRVYELTAINPLQLLSSG